MYNKVDLTREYGISTGSREKVMGMAYTTGCDYI